MVGQFTVEEVLDEGCLSKGWKVRTVDRERSIIDQATIKPCGGFQ
jgi:hypothetical protein